MPEKETLLLEQDISRIKEDVAVLKAESRNYATREDLQTVRVEIEKMGRTIIMWLSGMIIASTGTILAVLRLFR
ncbi:MAG: hypothetical protein HY579_06915 [Nitrospinae bacterium]|nr:hypothetical protein [Nitrospinota bacterium]